jgi:hypothetical protein
MEVLRKIKALIPNRSHLLNEGAQNARKGC